MERKRPIHLPQISAPFDRVLDFLEQNKIKSKSMIVNTTDLQPTQGLTFLDTITITTDDINPIWVAGTDDDENHIIDGHHRWVDKLSDNDRIKVFKIFLSPQKACRYLNKVQDIYEYEEHLKLEEIISHSSNINDRNTPRDDNFINYINDNQQTEFSNKPSNPETIIAYREKQINDNSVIGNFFILNPVSGYSKFEIEFDNLLDLEKLDLITSDTSSPISVLADLWFPNYDFCKYAENMGVDVDNIKTKAIKDVASDMGYDGVKYGSHLLQAF